MRLATASTLLLIATAANAHPRRHRIVPPRPVMLHEQAAFDLVDRNPGLTFVTLERDQSASFRTADVGDPPGYVAKKPARLRIRGRSIKLRVPLG